MLIGFSMGANISLYYADTMKHISKEINPL